jgi:ferredoxin
MRTPEGTRVIEVREDEHILDAAERLGMSLPATCRQGWCVTCAARLLEGEVDQSDALRYYSEDREAGFVLLCTAKPRSDLRIQTHAKEELVRERIRHSLPTPRG